MYQLEPTGQRSLRANQSNRSGHAMTVVVLVLVLMEAKAKDQRIESLLRPHCHLCAEGLELADTHT
jgi:hypothetical protein